MTERPKATITLTSNWTELFSEEKLSFTCDISREIIGDWEYRWFRDGIELTLDSYNYSYDYIELVKTSLQSGNYMCQGQNTYEQKSEASDSVTIIVSSGQYCTVFHLYLHYSSYLYLHKCMLGMHALLFFPMYYIGLLLQIT